MMLRREDIERALHRLDAQARQAGIVVDLAIYGGAALALAFDLRTATRDVDAVVQSGREFLRKAVAQIAADEGWPDDWLIEGVKGFISAHEQLQLMAEFAAPGAGLRVHLPTPRYLFAMKCMAMRADTQDVSDISALAGIAGIQTVDEALVLIEAFCARAQIPVKVRFGVEEIMQRLAAERDDKSG